MGIFSNVSKSESVDGKCSICGKKIKYLYKPSNKTEHGMLYSYTDILIVNICKSCCALRHSKCSSNRKNRLKEKSTNGPPGPNFLDALKGAVKGGEQENKALIDVLTKETKGLDCLNCGSFESLVAFEKKDGSVIKMKSGKRIL